MMIPDHESQDVEQANGLSSVNPSWSVEMTEEEDEEFYKLRPANKADHLCQLWQSSSNLFVDHVCVWMCQCQRGPQYPLTKSSCQPTVYAYERRCPIVKCHLYI